MYQFFTLLVATIVVCVMHVYSWISLFLPHSSLVKFGLVLCIIQCQWDGQCWIASCNLLLHSIFSLPPWSVVCAPPSCNLLMTFFLGSAHPPRFVSFLISCSPWIALVVCWLRGLCLPPTCLLFVVSWTTSCLFSFFIAARSCGALSLGLVSFYC